jgi:hypothetical protein
MITRQLWYGLVFTLANLRCHFLRICLKPVHLRTSSGPILDLLVHLICKPGCKTVLPDTLVLLSWRNSDSSSCHFQRSVKIPSRNRPSKVVSAHGLEIVKSQTRTIISCFVLATREDYDLHMIAQQLEYKDSSRFYFRIFNKNRPCHNIEGWETPEFPVYG